MKPRFFSTASEGAVPSIHCTNTTSFFSTPLPLLNHSITTTFANHSTGTPFSPPFNVTPLDPLPCRPKISTHKYTPTVPFSKRLFWNISFSSSYLTIIFCCWNKIFTHPCTLHKHQRFVAVFSPIRTLFCHRLHSISKLLNSYSVQLSLNISTTAVLKTALR